ncbi:hypothetical protein GALL_458280 [mine drainage metagenome]|uniref:Uncharacterized protein n=1 Tax=mine drainage metagenome TaxID=410659 RepID=A0A1J5PP26_9ZZZZ
MTRAHARVAPQNRRACQRQIAQRIQHLMPHGLVAIAEAARRHHDIAIDNHRVVQRATECEAIGAHRIHIRLTAEGAAVAQLPHKGAVRHVQRLVLTPDRAIREINVEIDLHLL